MALTLENINKSYGQKTVYKDFSISFGEGITAITGESGCGKTTLLNVIAGLIPFDGKVSGLPEGGVSYVFQDCRLIPFLTVAENVEFVMRRTDRDKRKAAVAKALTDTEMYEKRNSYPSELSGGQQRRVAVARAFAYPSDVLLMDEPFSSLDIGLKFRLIGLYKALFTQNPRTAVFVTHDIDEALALADRIVVLGNNCIKTEIFLKEPRNSRDLSSEECISARKKLFDILLERV